MLGKNILRKSIDYLVKRHIPIHTGDKQQVMMNCFSHYLTDLKALAYISPSAPKNME